jgi:hypothetical protein
MPQKGSKVGDMTRHRTIRKGRTLWAQNRQLKQELRSYRTSLHSVLNILDPDQWDIIKGDLIHVEQLNQRSDA